jgi:Dyp-type peroxidase family
MSTPPPDASPSLPLRENTEIQGDVIAGFKKDHVRLLFLRFADPWHARMWLRQLPERIATTRDVAAFNAEFSQSRRLLGGDDPSELAAVWRGVSFTHAGLVALVGGSPIADVPRGTTQEAFVQGIARRKDLLGDTGQNDPDHWLFGAEHNDAVHAVLTVAADRPDQLRKALGEERQQIACNRLAIVFEQQGGTLPGKRRGTEHFGFKDGISQPGVQGFDPPDPERPEHQDDKPGTRMIPAGEFVVGHPMDHRLPAWLPDWMRDGSFQVVRRLGQDVTGWWTQAARHLKELKEQEAVPEDATDEWVAARLVGRWPSGAPVGTFPDADPPAPPGPETENDISYHDDQEGRVTPLFCHLRKISPRDGLRADADDTVTVPEKGVLDGHRIMRRGVPYGPLMDDAGGDVADADVSRGLVFVGYQSDLVAQFEFVQRNWVQSEDFPERDPKPGRDGVLGLEGTVSFPAERLGPTACAALDMRQFVRTEGAVYAFAPSLSALRSLAEGTIPVGGGRPESRVLTAPTVIRSGEVVSSGRARLRFETNGDLTVRDENEELLWQAGVAGRGAERAEFRETGELVLPDESGEIVWTSETGGNPDATLVVGVEGDVAIRAANGRLLWHTDTAH